MEREEVIDTRLQLLISKHRNLDTQADELSKKRYLLPGEYNILKRLKLMRLHAKRAIDRYKEHKTKE
jgi:hypothetical protein